MQWVTNSGGAERMAFMRKSSGMLFFLDADLQEWVCLFDGATLTGLERFGELWPGPANSLPLTDEELRLPRTLGEFPVSSKAVTRDLATDTRICNATSSSNVRRPSDSLAHRRRLQTLLLHRLPRQLRPRPPRLQSLFLLQDLYSHLWSPLPKR